MLDTSLGTIMQQTSMRLPLELVVEIIPFLDDRLIEEWEFSHSPIARGRRSPSLFACSLVCHAWNDLCRSLIFRSIRIDCNEDIDHSELWVFHFKVPHLCKYIRELLLSFSFETTPPPEWIGACLGRFTNLRTLELRFWSVLMVNVRTPLLLGITSTISTVGLRCLALQDWDSSFVNDPSYLLAMLSACSTTLEELMIDFRSKGASFTTMPVVPPAAVVHLQALRHLKLYQPPTSFARTAGIECPNLETFATSQGDLNAPWELPSWIPGSISELNLQGTFTFYPYLLWANQVTLFPVASQCSFPQLRRPIYPSRLTFQLVPFDGDMAWIGECINHFPFLDCLRQLTIKSLSNHSQLSFPDASRYEALYRFLQPLQRSTLMKRVTFTIAFHRRVLDIPDVELESIRTRELARLEEMFLPLKAVGFSIQLVVILYWGDSQRRVLIRCSV